MSKASEFRDRMEAACQAIHTRPKPYGTGWGEATVSQEGNLLIDLRNGFIPSEYALGLANWILEVFGEEK